MCCGRDRLPSKDDVFQIGPSVETLTDRLAETEARLEQARALEAELSRRLEELKKFMCVMQILQTYLRRKCNEQRDLLIGL